MEVKSEYEVHIQQYKGNVMSFSDLTLSFVSLAMGTGITKAGAAFTNGWLTATLISTFFAVVDVFSIYLQVLAFLRTKTGTIEQCAYFLLPRWAFKPFLIISIMPMLFCGYFYIQFCESSIISFFQKVFPNFQSLWLDPMVIDVMLLLFIYIPTTLSPKAKHFKYLFRLKAATLLFIFLVVTIIFAEKVYKIGLDPNNESVAAIPTIDSFTACVSTYATAYLIQPISMPSINNLDRPTYKRIMWVIFVACFIQWIFNQLFGLFEYYTLFNKNDGDVFFNYFHSVLSDTANIVLSLMMILSCSMLTYPTRNVIFNVIIPGIRERNVGMWTFLAIVNYVIVMYLLKVKSAIMETLLALILDLTAPISMLVFPSLLYILAFKKESLWRFVLAIVFIVLGIILACYFMFKAFISLSAMFSSP